VVHVANKSAHDVDEADDDMNISKQIALETITQHTSKTIKIDHFGAVSTTDPQAPNGYYLVQWTGVPYNLQQSCTEQNGIIQAGELVCNAVYLNSLAHMAQWYTPYANNADGSTIVRISTVLNSDVDVNSLNEVTLPPNTPQYKNTSTTIKCSSCN
jgi:hypothetical protein